MLQCPVVTVGRPETPAIDAPVPRPPAAITVAWPPVRVTQDRLPPPPRVAPLAVPPQGPWRLPLSPVLRYMLSAPDRAVPAAASLTSRAEPPAADSTCDRLGMRCRSRRCAPRRSTGHATLSAELRGQHAQRECLRAISCATRSVRLSASARRRRRKQLGAPPRRRRRASRGRQHPAQRVGASSSAQASARRSARARRAWGVTPLARRAPQRSAQRTYPRDGFAEFADRRKWRHDLRPVRLCGAAAIRPRSSSTLVLGSVQEA